MGRSTVAFFWRDFGAIKAVEDYRDFDANDDHTWRE